MRKIVSFKKELSFKTKVSEITSISLEHQIKQKEEDLISGEFLINGEYKMTEGSINREKYNFILPFDIALNSNYDLNTAKIDIDNFYYEIINNEILKVNIDILLETNEKEIRNQEIENTEEIRNKDIAIENIKKENQVIEINNEQEEKIELSNNNDIKIDNNNINTNINLNTNILDNIDNNETYNTYYVYIVKEDDTIDKILDKYKITKEDLELYNNIENIKTYDKIIIPTNGK